MDFIYSTEYRRESTSDSEIEGKIIEVLVIRYETNYGNACRV